MRFAYADPPYPGQAKRWYGDHPDYGGEVDHAELVARLVRDYPDGWALSTSMVALREVLWLCPPRVTVATWHNTWARPAGYRAWRQFYCWEPVILSGGRPAPQVRNHLDAPAHSGTAGNAQFVGLKPPAFCRWVFAMLGARPGDELDDLFPGSGTVGREWEIFSCQPQLEDPRPAPQLPVLW